MQAIHKICAKKNKATIDVELGKWNTKLRDISFCLHQLPPGLDGMCEFICNSRRWDRETAMTYTSVDKIAFHALDLPLILSLWTNRHVTIEHNLSANILPANISLLNWDHEFQFIMVNISFLKCTGTCTGRHFFSENRTIIKRLKVICFMDFFSRRRSTNNSKY